MKKDFRYYSGKAWNKIKEWDADEVNKRPWIGIRGRQIVVLALVIVLSCYVGVFLLKYTVLDGDRWRMLAGSQQMSTLTIKASRGSIYDANGTVLAQAKRFETGASYADLDIHRLSHERRRMNTYQGENLREHLILPVHMEE